MTIKRLKTATPSSVAGAPAQGASEAAPKAAATIADRFKLDTPDAKTLKAASSSKRATQFALTAAILALIVAGLLAFTLYKHWEFLMPA